MDVSQVFKLLDTVKDAEAFKKRLAELENVRQVNAAEYAKQIEQVGKLKQQVTSELKNKSDVFEKQVKQRTLELEDKARKESEELNARFSRAVAQLEDARSLMAKALKLQELLDKKELELVEFQKQLQSKATELGVQEQQLKVKAVKIQEVLHG